MAIIAAVAIGPSPRAGADASRDVAARSLPDRRRLGVHSPPDRASPYILGPMDTSTRDRLLKLVGLAFTIPQLVMGAIFAGLSLYAFVVHWWPAFDRYRHGKFAANESAVVLFASLAFGIFFFVIGAVLLITGFRALGRVLGGGALDEMMATRVTPEEVAESRNRVMGFPRLVHLRHAAAAIVQHSDPLRRLLDPVRTPEGFYELRSRPLHRILGLVLLGFAAVWNGVILAGASDLVRWSLVGLVFGLFLLPFVLVGLALLVGAAYFLAALLHPELTVRVRADLERRTLEGAWSFGRPPSRLRTLVAVLRVSELQIHGTGDEATTKSIPVLEQTLVEGASLGAQDRGQFSYRWPEGLELPRRSGERQVEWLIHFRAEAARPPNFHFWVPIVG
jgi:hypothetical protein